MPSRGSLVIVGTGINTFAHCSAEALAHIEQAEQLIVHVPDPLGMSWLRERHPHLIDLQPCYRTAGNRADAYELMVRTIVDAVEQGLRTVVAFYGHPGVFVSPSHEAIRRLRKEGYDAKMLPGISAEDCLFADLGVDPARHGCAQYEATRFLFYKTAINTSAGLILWQIGVVGDHTLTTTTPGAGGLQALQRKLLRSYPPAHQVAVYEASALAAFGPSIVWTALSALDTAPVSPISTLYVPPLELATPDMEALASMQLSFDEAIGNVKTLPAR